MRSYYLKKMDRNTRYHFCDLNKKMIPSVSGLWILDIVAHGCDPITKETEAGRLGGQS